jgi:VanZ family protein
VNGVLNLICFVPFGVVIANLSFVGQPIVAAAAYCGCLSLVVEVLQLFLPGRYGCVSDWLLNTVGGIIGAGLASSI